MVRTHKKKKSKQFGVVDTTEADKATPKSIIVFRGDVGSNVRGLMHEWRRVFSPWSSRRLHGKKNTLKDFLHIASTFSVSHLQLMTVPSAGASLRIMRFSNGPTLSLRIESFALRDDIIKTQRRPAPVDGPAYDAAPIVVLNNFTAYNSNPEVALMESTFQSMFPSLNIHTVNTTELQRVVLFHFDSVSGTVETRHFYVQSKAVGLSKTVKKLAEGRLPSKLGSLEHVDNLLEREGAWSDTDGEGEEVELPKSFRQHKDQCRVKLVEIGPRMTLRLMKVEAGFAGGEVIYHHHREKTAKDAAQTAQRVRQRSNEKKRRRATQEANVEKKKEERTAKLDAKKRRRLEREEVARGGGDDDDDDDDEDTGRGFEEVGAE